MDKLFFGAAYYPELWDKTEIDKDIARCKSLGINCLRVGEFAWSKIEPREGEFHTEWLVEIVDKLYENGIYTVMCTPTCTPPRYMLDKYAEMRRVDAGGKRVAVSSRCHVCKNSSVAREKNRLVVEALAKAFVGHKGAIGWQIDNELFPYDEGCFCDTCVKRFREYLKREYGTVEALNSAWGMARWSLEYASFDDVLPPRPSEWRHPSLRNAWWLFQCESVKSFVDEQAKILHDYGYTDVGSDMMTNNNLSYYDINEKLDRVMFNHYERADELKSTAFSYDFLRCVKDKPFWVTETQVGWNGSEYAENGYRPIGNCYVNTFLPFACGARMNMYWLFRAHPNGHELAHGALYSAAGRPYRVTEEVGRAIADLKKCESVLCEKISSEIALCYSATAANCFGSAPLVKGFDYRAAIKRCHAAFMRHDIDVIDTAHSFDGYKVVLSPFLAYFGENDFGARIEKWVENGGVWIVGPMSDIFDKGLRRFTSSPFGMLEEAAGVYVKYQKPIDSDAFSAKLHDGAPIGISTCYDAFEPLPGTRSLATYDGGEFDGLSVVTERKLGKGRIVLVGSELSGADIIKLAGISPIAKASDNIVLSRRGDGIVAVETENKPGYIHLPGEYFELISEKYASGKTEIPPYSACVYVKR